MMFSNISLSFLLVVFIPKILIFISCRAYGTLADTLNYQINKNQLQFGSPLEYAATHQFGRDSANIPARPFLGLSNDDNDEVLDILRSHLAKAL